MTEKSTNPHRLERLLRSARKLESSGPGPFISRHVLLRKGGQRITLLSRDLRKGLFARAGAAGWWRCLWMPGQLNWWIGGVFALGSVLFMLGSVVVLAPDLANSWSLDNQSANLIFFAGSIPFSIAAYLQLFQAANAQYFARLQPVRSGRVALFGWRPREIGWLASALQFAGTLLFNLNTFDGLLPAQGWVQQDLSIWVPDFAGSLLFLASGYLALIETCHAYWAWKPASLSWWLTLINFCGCVAFMISAVLALVLPGFDMAMLATLFTLIGGGCFLLGSLLMWPEAALSGRAKPVQAD
jgi:hypothetical protein